MNLEFEFMTPDLRRFNYRTPEFHKYAAIVDKIPYCEHAGRFHDMMSGATVWDDEAIDLPMSEFRWYRAVLAYRQSLRFGSPNEFYESAWEALRLAAPNWPGFRKERCEEGF
jgi:hypothetical protein